LEHSDLLHQLAGGCRVEFTENRRSDPELFEFCGRLGEDRWREALASGRVQFPLKNERPRYSLSVSHATRMAVNRETNLAQRLDHPEAILYKPPRVKEDNRPQSFWCWPGLEVIGHGAPTKKGLFYTVTSCDRKRVRVEGNGESVTLPAERAAKRLRLSHCITYASCQGLSLDGVRLLETSSPHFSWRHLYVGASRCTSARALEIA
jgi:hypothetical protein